jgi:hypothetical protein
MIASGKKLLLLNYLLGVCFLKHQTVFDRNSLWDGANIGLGYLCVKAYDEARYGADLRAVTPDAECYLSQHFVVLIVCLKTPHDGSKDGKIKFPKIPHYQKISVHRFPAHLFSDEPGVQTLPFRLQQGFGSEP